MNKITYVQYALLGAALIVLVYVAIHDAPYVEQATEIEIIVDDNGGDYVLIRSEEPAPAPPPEASPAPPDEAPEPEPPPAEAPSPPPEAETNYVNANTPDGGGR